MFTRDEALALWDDLNATKDAFLQAYGELVLTRCKLNSSYVPHCGDDWGYFVRANNICFTQEMVKAYNQVCEKHSAEYRIEVANEEMRIIFYKKASK